MMKNLLFPVAFLLLSVNAIAQNNVGIGTNTPGTKLQVEGAISSTPVQAQAQAAYIIPNNTSVFRLTAAPGTQSNALSMAVPHEGQYLIIFNDDNDAATFAGFTLTGGATITLNYISGAWRLTGRSDAIGPSGTQGPAGPQGPAGVSAYTTTTAGYTQPVLGNNVSVNVVNTSWMTTGQAVFVGGSGGYYIINSITNGTTVVLTYLGGGGTGMVGTAGSGVSSSGQTGATGAQGPQGTVGAQGPQGNVGPQGSQGPQGAAGATGPTGLQGNVGPQGPQGNVGPQGPQGNVGAQGPQGNVGPQGAQGPQGVQGNVGPQGPQGPVGLLSAGTAAGNTTYWDGSQWVLSSNNLYNNGGNIGIGTNNPGWKLDVVGTGRFGANTSQNTHAALAVSAGQGAATRFRDIDIDGSWSGGEEHAISFTHGTAVSDLVAQITARHTSPGSSLLFGSLYHSGNTASNTMELRSTSGSTADLLLSGYLNTTDNGSSGTAHTVTGIMVKAGDNYHRTADPVSVRNYLGITAPTGDNLGNHTATTTLNMQGNVIRFGTNNVSYQNAGAGSTYGSGDPTNGIGWGNQPLDEYGVFVAPQEAPHGDYTRLVLGWHTGVKIGAYPGYGGTRFYNNSPMYGGANATEIFSVGKGDNNVRVNYDIATVGDIVADQNYGKGLVGVYSQYRYQNVYSMGASYRLAADGTTPGNMYGIAWGYPDAGAQAKGGLSHQMMVMENGVTKVALGSGIWTNYDITGNRLMDQNDGSYYVDPNGTSNTAYWTGRAKAGIGLTGKYTTPRWDYTGDQNYWTGSMGWGATDLNDVGTWGSGFFDTWGLSPGTANDPGTTSHYTGVQSFHYTAGSNSAYGFQMVSTTGTNRFHLRTAWPSWQPWVEMITTGNITSQVAAAGFIPNNGSGDWQIASSSGATHYGAASLELRETNFAGSGQTPPHLGFHWGGVVASNISIEGDGTIAIRDNPGTGYEKFRCATIRTSGITETSDARLKKEVTPITNAMDAVMQLNGVNYKWKTNEELKAENISYQTNDDVNPKGEMGFIAQEVEKILPQLVNTDKEGFKSMEYSKMVALLVEAYKDLNKQHQQLQGQYSTLSGQVQMLMQQMPSNGAASINSTITK
jgi:hypothetical protein